MRKKSIKQQKIQQKRNDNQTKKQQQEKQMANYIKHRRGKNEL